MILGLHGRRTAPRRAAGATEAGDCLLLAAWRAWLSDWRLHSAGVCPIVKKIWTPSFTLVSGGICLLTLAAALRHRRHGRLARWAFPAVVVGQNSDRRLRDDPPHRAVDRWTTLHRHFGARLFHASSGRAYQPLLENLAVGAFVWLICYWMYRRQILPAALRPRGLADAMNRQANGSCYLRFSISTQMPPARMALCIRVNQISCFQCRPSCSQSRISSARL